MIDARAHRGFGTAVHPDRRLDIGAAWAHYNTWDWLSGTDWHRDAYSTGNTSTATNTKATFRNTLFCNRLANTYAYHYRTEVRGYTKGTWDWGWSSDKAGDCASLLSAGYYVETP
jgi:hypothetical protein